MAERNKMPTGLKITTKSGIVLHDTAFIAGLYNNSNINEEEEEGKEDKNEFDDAKDDIGEILPDKKSTREFTILENDDNDEASINNDNEDNSNVSEDEEDNITESGNSSKENNDQGDKGNPTAYPTPYNTTRSGRVSKPPVKLSLSQYNFPTQGYKNIEYTNTSARVFANTVYQNDEQTPKSVSVNADIQSECWAQEVWRERMG